MLGGVPELPAHLEPTDVVVAASLLAIADDKGTALRAL
jgi:hypothetical protein